LSKAPVGEVVATSVLILALALFMSPILACLATFAAAVAFLALSGRGGGLTLSVFASTSLTLSLASIVTGVTAYLMGSGSLLLISLILGYASPVPLAPIAVQRLGGRGRARAVAATLILSVGILTLPLYGAGPLNTILRSAGSTIVSVESSGLYALIGYAPSSTAVVIGYLIMIYTLVSCLKSFLQETSSQAPPPPQPP